MSHTNSAEVQQHGGLRHRRLLPSIDFAHTDGSPELAAGARCPGVFAPMSRRWLQELDTENGGRQHRLCVQVRYFGELSHYMVYHWPVRLVCPATNLFDDV